MKEGIGWNLRISGVDETIIVLSDVPVSRN